MALQKAIETNYGVTANYWRLTQIHIDYAQKIGYAILSPYISQEDRQNNKMSLPSADKRINFNVEIFNSYLAPEALEENNWSLYQAVFEYAKTLDMFEGAQDIL